jgi:hypothetical protein
MRCKSCTSTSRQEFSAEINVHFSGWEGLKRPGVFVFPKLFVCMDCGFTECFIPERELAGLAGGCENVKPNKGGRSREMEQSMAQDCA